MSKLSKKMIDLEKHPKDRANIVEVFRKKDLERKRRGKVTEKRKLYFSNNKIMCLHAKRVVTEETIEVALGQFEEIKVDVIAQQVEGMEE